MGSIQQADQQRLGDGSSGKNPAVMPTSGEHIVYSDKGPIDRSQFTLPELDPSMDFGDGNPQLVDRSHDILLASETNNIGIPKLLAEGLWNVGVKSVAGYAGLFTAATDGAAAGAAKVKQIEDEWGGFQFGGQDVAALRGAIANSEGIQKAVDAFNNLKVTLGDYGYENGGPLGGALLYAAPDAAVELLGPKAVSLTTRGVKAIGAELAPALAARAEGFLQKQGLILNAVESDSRSFSSTVSTKNLLDSPFELDDFLRGGSDDLAFYRKVPTSKGAVEIKSKSITVEDSTLKIDDVHVFPVGQEKVSLGFKEVKRTLQNMANEMGTVGFDKVVVTGQRITGAKVINNAANKTQSVTVIPKKVGGQ